jgi:hypothetical protein
MYRSSLGLASLVCASSLLASGSARADVPNDDPVAVEITSPTDGESFSGPTATLDVELTVTNNGSGGISKVELMVNDELVMTDMAEPWGFTGVELSGGMHTLVAVPYSAFDGGPYPSAPVQVVVFEDTSTSTAGGDEASDDKGCSIHAASLGELGLGLLSLLVLGLGLRRRARA